MSFRRIFIPFLFFLMGLGGSFMVHASAVECGGLSACRGLGSCSQVVSLTCGNQMGFVKNEAPLDSLKVIVTKSNGQQQVYILKNPPGGVRDYYEGVEKHPWVINQLRGKLAYGDTVEVHQNGYGLKSGAPLYADWDAQEQIGVVGESGDSGSEMLCSYALPPVVITTKSCGKFCMSRVFCTIEGIDYDNLAFCRANNNGLCPKASKCAAYDPDMPEIKFSPNFNEFGDPIVPADGLREGLGRSGGGSSGSGSKGGGNASGNDAGGGKSLQ